MDLRIGLTDRLRVRAAISRKRWLHLQPRAKRWTRRGRSGSKINRTSRLAYSRRLDAGLGRKEDAIREALQAVDLLPIAKDSYWGPGQVTNLALVYAWTGERERALEQLEVVAKIPVGGSESGATYGDLKFNPCWDYLRGDPRFEKIVAAAKAASR